MAIQSIKNGKSLRKYGEKLGREGIAKRVIELCKEVAANENYKEAIKAAGKIRALAMACNYDCYWREKAEMGFEDELDVAIRQNHANSNL